MADYPEYLLAQGDAARIPIPDKSVDLVIGSPPYCDARTYGIGAQRDAREWVTWMLEVTAEAVRVSRGLVLWVCAGVTRDHCYWPACEGLLWRWWESGGKCWRPAFWHRVGIPGSGGKKWLRADVEYVLCFKGPDNDSWTDNTAMGRPPKYSPGGKPSHRTTNGRRVNECRPINPERRAAGREQEGEVQFYSDPKVANPGNFHGWEFGPDEAAWLEEAFIHTNAGGGHLGSELAHLNDAPFPESLAEFFVRSFCPPGGILCDPFSGSGTSAVVALKNDRRAIGFDLRRSQADLGTRRIAESLRPVSRLDGSMKPVKPLAGQLDLFT